MIPTDQEPLKEKYDGLPPCVDAGNERDLSTWLLEQVQRLALQKIEDAPQHNFFIGLAYLNGIDVEVNHERAVEIISDAAKNGLTEAISKLADMYWVGDGVDRDYATSVEWQEKLTWKLSFRYRNDKSQANATAFMQALLKLADNCCTLGQMDKAWNVYKQQFDLAEAASKESATPENLLFLASAYERMGGMANGSI